jgi:hypothetical protein
VTSSVDRVLTANVALVAFAAITTWVGTVAKVELLLSAIVIPPAGAGLLSFTVAVEVAPPVTLVGFRPNELSEAAGVTDREAVFVTLL